MSFEHLPIPNRFFKRWAYFSFRYQRSALTTKTLSAGLTEVQSMLGKLGKWFSSQQPSDENESQPAAPNGRWMSEMLDGHAVHVFDPNTDEKPTGCVMFLHGHGQVLLNDNAAFTNLLQQYNLVAVCPNGERSWWMDRICNEFSPDVSPQNWLVDQLLPFIEERWGIEPPKIAMLGVSMGGQGALQLSFRHAAQFPVVAAISPAVDFHQLYGQNLPLDEMFEDIEDARQATVVLNLHPLAWPRYQWFCCDPADTDWFDGCVRLGMKLSSSGILHERDLDTSAGAHSWDYFNHMAPKAFEHIAKGLAAY